MLFNSTISNLSANVQSLQTKIDEFEAALKQLRAEKSAIEAEIQQVATLEGAAESAVTQAANFINAATALQRGDLLATFWEAMDALKTADSDRAALPSSNADEPAEKPPASPAPTNDDGETIIEVNISAPTTEQFLGSAKPASTAESTPAPQEVGEQPGLDFSDISWPRLKSFAARNGIKAKRRNEVEEAIANAQISQTALNALKA